MAIKDNVKENIKGELGRLGITRTELARRAGVRIATISDILNDHMEPSVTLCEKLAIALGMNPTAIFLDPPRKSA